MARRSIPRESGGGRDRPDLYAVDTGDGREPAPAGRGDARIAGVEAILSAQAAASGLELAASLPSEPNPTYLADAEGNLLYGNGPFELLRPALMPAAGASGRRLEVLSDTFERLRRGEAQLYDLRSIEQDGKPRIFAGRHFPLEAKNPGEAGFAGTYIDITRGFALGRIQAEAERRLEDYLRSTSDWVWECDSSLRLTYVSGRIGEVLGTPAKALTGRFLLTLGYFANDEDGAAVHKLTALRAPFRGAMFVMETQSGDRRHIALSGVPIFDSANGRFAGFRGTGTDVSRAHEAEQRASDAQASLARVVRDLKERNAQLDQALAESQAAIRTKTDFLARMSHELRTPLNAIIGFSELSAQQPFGEMHGKYLGYFQDICRSGRHLLAMIEDILDATRIESATIEIKLEPVDVGASLAEARSVVGLRAEQKQVDLSRVILDQKYWVKSDKRRLTQIFVNLLTNAIKFSPPGSRVGVEIGTIGELWVDVGVWDTGIGIEADQLDRVFEPFYQIKADAMIGANSGAGLGLGISRDLARLMGGDIKATSTPGRGSSFTVRLARAIPPRES
jgi:PAS domain S-box-containing protein